MHSFMPCFMVHFFKKWRSQKSLSSNVIVSVLVFVVGCPRKFQSTRTFWSPSYSWPQKFSTWDVVPYCGGLVWIKNFRIKFQNKGFNLKLEETAKLRDSTIGKISISSELSIIKYKPKMKKWPPKSLESRFLKSPCYYTVVWRLWSFESWSWFIMTIRDVQV